MSLYYYTSVPLLTCNVLFYSITSLSASISSSQTVVKFISERKECDSVLFTNEIADTDLEHKLRITESLIYDILRRFSVDDREFEQVKQDILCPTITETVVLDNNEFTMIELKTPFQTLERIDDPLKLALVSTADTMRQINALLVASYDKIHQYTHSYVKNVFALSLQQETKLLRRQVRLLDGRLSFLLELIKIYMPFKKGGRNAFLADKEAKKRHEENIL